MDLRAAWMKFRGTPFFRLSYLVLVAFIAAFVRILDFSTGIVCFSIFMIPVLTLLVPHWFGERRIKHHSLNGLFVLVLTPLLFALVVTPNWMAQSEFVLSQDGERTDLSEGKVAPYRTAAPGPADFNFTVLVRSDDPNAANFTVHLRVRDFENFAVSEESVRMARDPSGDGAFPNGERFFATVRLAPLAHSYDFQALNGTAVEAQTFVGLGPFNADFGTYFALWWYSGILSLIFVMIGFYLLVVVYWWTRKARTIRGARTASASRKRDEGGGEYTCTNCGGDVSEADTKCPNCGAEFGPGAGSELATGKA